MPVTGKFLQDCTLAVAKASDWRMAWPEPSDLVEVGGVFTTQLNHCATNILKKGIIYI